MIQILFAIFIISISFNSLVSAKCTYSIDEIKITEFTGNSDSLYQNSLNLTQGWLNTTSELAVYNLDNSSFPVSAQITAKDATSAWFTSLDACNGGRINSSFEYLQIVVKKPFLISLTIKTRSRISCDPFAASSTETNSFALVETDFEPLSGDTFAVQIPLRQMTPSSIASAALLSQIEITRMTPITLVSISVLSVAATCINVKPSIPGMAWKKDQVLMVNDLPYRFMSFKMPDNFISLVDLEMDNFMKTIMIFANGSSAVTSTFGIIKTCKDCLVIKYKTYNEQMLKKLDLILFYAQKYNVKVVFEFMDMYDDIVAFCSLSGCSQFSEDASFYKSPQAIDAFKHVISAIVNRNNTLTGTIYRDDPHIFFWSLGYRLVTFRDDMFPPASWVIEISEYIKSIDPNHLVHDGYSRVDNKRFAPFSIWNIESVDIHGHQYFSFDEYEPYKFCQRALAVARTFKKIFFVQSMSVWNDGSFWISRMADVTRKCFAHFVEPFDKQNFESSPGAGIFLDSLCPHMIQGSKTLYDNFEFIRYPPVDFPLPEYKIYMNMTLEIAAKIKAIYEGRQDLISVTQLPVPKGDPPLILNISLSSMSKIQMFWFGTVGSTEYYVSRSFDNRTFANETRLHFVYDKPYHDDLKIKEIDCPLSVYYRLVAKNSDFNWETAPAFGSIQINPTKSYDPSSCIKVSSTSETNVPDKKVELIEIILMSSVAVLLVSSAAILLYIRNRLKRQNRFISSNRELLSTKRVQESNAVTETIQMTKTNALNFSVPGYLELNEETDFQIREDKVVGSGYTAIIYEGILTSPSLLEKHGKMKIAIKRILIQDESAEAAMSNFLYEVAIISNLPQSPNIICVLGYTQRPYLSLVMKYYRCSLKDFIGNEKIVIDSLSVSKIAYDISNGMRIIHKCGILHLDLKPHNVLLDVFDDLQYNCVISDFGFSSIIGRIDGSRREVSGLNMPQNAGITVRYAAPELFAKFSTASARLNSEEDKKIDVYAWAITTFETITRNNAWESSDFETVRKKVLVGERPQFTDQVLSDHGGIPWLIHLIKEAWLDDPERRPSFESIFQTIQAATADTITFSANFGEGSK